MSQRGRTGNVFRRWPVPVTAGLAVALIVAAGWYLRHTQEDAAAKLRNDFAQRARIAAGLTTGLLSASANQNRAFAEASFALPVEQLAAAVQANTTPGNEVFILGPDGAVLATDAPVPLADAATAAITNATALARDNGTMAFSDLFAAPDGPKVWMALSFDTPYGQRFFVASLPAAQIAMLAEPYLGSALGVTGGNAMVVDGTGAVVLSTAGATAGEAIPDAPVVAALRHAPVGTTHGRSYASVPVTGSRWNVVLITSEATLLAPIRSTKRVAWQLFGAFVVALALMLGLGARLVLSSARLAHARLHDALTGLPTRALFLARTEQAITQRQGGGVVAALFLDLDGFKPINDTYGHATGDALLAAVAERLTATVRPGDVVSRFGGDEFLVLCTGLSGESAAATVADRIQQAVTQPFTIDGLTVRVGVSIGLATYDENTAGADGLIHNADLAMYQAKQGGRGRTAHYTPELAH